MDRFPIYRFSLCWEVPAGTGLFMQLLARIRYFFASYETKSDAKLLHSWGKEVSQNSPAVT